MKKIKYIIISGILSFLPISAYATSADLTVSCNSAGVTPGNFTTCSISTKTTGGTLKTISAKYDLGGLTFDSFIAGSQFGTPLLNDASGFSLSSDAGIDEIGTVGTLKVGIPVEAAGAYNLTLKDVSATDTNGNNVTLNVIPGNVKIASTDNTLSSLAASGVKIDFKPDTNEYSATVNTAAITITVKTNDSKATVTGDGKKDLEFGLNTFDIVVTSEAGTTNVYKLNITRSSSKSTDNYLSKLEIENYKIDFDKEKSDYKVNIGSDVDNIKLKFAIADFQSKLEIITTDGVESKVDDTIINIKNLKIGKNIITLKITSESGDVRTYNIEVERGENSSSMTENPNTGLFNGITLVSIISIIGLGAYIIVRKKSKFSQL